MDIDIVYHFETPQQFWAELEDILHITPETSLAGIDYALKTFVKVCANNHERFLQANAQLDHAAGMLLNSELFGTHSQRSTDHILNDAKANDDPHAQLILYKVLLAYGFRQPSFFRNLRKWSPLVPFLMDHVLVEVDDSGAYSYGAGIGGVMGLGFPIEARLRAISIQLLYEICRVQKIDVADLKLFTEDFINHLFELVEETRSNPDETLNYGLIKLIVALNEQFMVASLPPPTPHSPATSHSRPPRSTASPALGSTSVKIHSGRDSPSTSNQPISNRVLNVLMRRLGASKTFGENLIFMLNRAENTPEDLCMQLLILKLLYLLFTTHGTQEYFYTNDLRVLVDVFIRELVDLPDESESLRHTYLRVLHPLLNNTQLRSHPYKRPQIRNVLQSLIAHAHIRDITPTTRRLVDRCMKGSWVSALETELSSLQQTQGETRSVDSGFKSKSSFVAAEEATRGTKAIHKSASMTFTKSGSGSGAGVTRAPTKSDASRLEKKADAALTGGSGRIPRSADAVSGSHTFSSHPPGPERQGSLDSAKSGHLQLPNMATLSLTSAPTQNATSLAEVDGAWSHPDDQSNQPSILSVSNSMAIAVTAATPVDDTHADIPKTRPRSSSTKKDRSLPPPPRPPPLRKRKSSDLARFEQTPSRNNSMGEVSHSGVGSDERVVPSAVDGGRLMPQALHHGTAIRRSAPPTPPPKRRKAPAVPTGRKGTTMTTIASSSGGAAVGFEVTVPVR